ncbi:MAG: tRNA lysidine(34) synthetase, partial [Candidatus Puniceispirillaceae bacterium]
MTANPIIAYDDRFAAAMARLGLDQCNGYLTAVSGGPDSTALALLTARYAAVAGKPHQAVIINHQLRAEAGAEARRVQARLLRYQISADIIPITAPRPASGLQEWARLNRHNILRSMARQRDAALLFGHHAGDQAETVAMRLLKGSGLAGL